MKLFVRFLIFIFFATEMSLSSEKINIFNFNDNDLTKFKSHSIKKKTNYSIIKENGESYLKAEAEGQASGLGREIKVDLNKTPFLNITWKVEQGILGIKENSKKGHDFAARVSVIKETGSLPWQKKAMNYVFSSNEKTNSHWMGPYRKQIIDYVASSLVDSKENSWVTVKLNVKEHFKKFLDLDLVEIDGVAIMTDTDNTKQKAVSYYKNIYFSN
tara:strand:+ start:7009 stop:7653 length:645 start_codon:yes stop_codon:yes gene_type:complete